MKKEINKLANTILENLGVYREYSDEDLADAALIFTEVFWVKIYDNHKDKLSQKELENIAKEAGKSLRQTILLFTGIDMHKIYEKNTKTKSK